MDCIDIIEIVISLDCVIGDLYDLVILFKYIIVMRNWIVLICECPSDYLKVVEVVGVEDGEYDWIEGNGG